MKGKRKLDLRWGGLLLRAKVELDPFKFLTF
jgi:hypothetical protein